MSDMLDWRVLARSTLRRWWLPVALALVGAVLGVYASTNLNPVYRSQGTVLVGPLDSTVTRSTTLRASESLAVFYADLARREAVLVPVRERLDLSMSLDELRNSVSAMVPDQNPRVVTVTVEGDSERQARRIAVAIVDELVSLSPAPTGVTQPAFVSAQADALETSIQETEAEIDEMRASLAETTDPDEATSIRRSIDLKQQYLNDSRQTYVELMSLEPDSDAGGLAVLDNVAGVPQAGRVGPRMAAVLGGVVGAVLGILVVWLLDRRRRTAEPVVDEPSAPLPAAPTVNLVVRPTASGTSRRLPRMAPRRTTTPPTDRAPERVNGTRER